MDAGRHGWNFQCLATAAIVGVGGIAHFDCGDGGRRYWRLDQTLSADVEGQLGKSATQRISAIERHYRRNRQMAESWAKKPVFAAILRASLDTGPPPIPEMVRRQLVLHSYRGVLVVDSQRRIRAASDGCGQNGEPVAAANDAAGPALAGRAGCTGFSGPYPEMAVQLPDPASRLIHGQEAAHIEPYVSYHGRPAGGPGTIHSQRDG